MTTTFGHPDLSGYADVNGVHLYHEVYGSADAEPLVLLHGGMMSIEQFAELVPLLADHYRVLAVELQGHGRTADVEREITPAHSASDVVALLDHLGIDRAHVLGHSMGGAVALELAVSHPDRVLSVVPASITVRPEGMVDDFASPERIAASDRMPTLDDMASMRETYERLSPTPERFDDFLATLSASNTDLVGWTDEQLGAVEAPVLLVVGDHDFTRIDHAGLMLDLIPRAHLAVLPGTTHMGVVRRTDLLVPMVTRFLG